MINVVLEGAASAWLASPAFQRRYREMSLSVEDCMNNSVGRRRRFSVVAGESQVGAAAFL